MDILHAEYITSSVKINQCPVPDKPEYAFIGRSNVGKSSLINMLTGRRKLAKVSGSPGKTITINHFLINGSWYLVDLPGYGYAKRSKTERTKWEKLIRQYILQRTNLLTLFLLIDMRHEPQANDLEFMEWLAVSQIPFTILFTKSDKLSLSDKDKNLNKYHKTLEKDWEQLPNYFITSAIKRKGKDKILDYIEQTNEIFSQKG
ncbi:MAG TPA: YihA family ribosome biogenesis GTP-binding protein [Bacteroidetes bacterium]|nr:YihA family ribosome biogenesis GTP-binding protein [Bacteroidota bacterium]